MGRSTPRGGKAADSSLQSTWLASPEAGVKNKANSFNNVEKQFFLKNSFSKLEISSETE